MDVDVEDGTPPKRGFENILVFQSDPTYQEIWDKARMVVCRYTLEDDFDLKEKRVVFRPVVIDMLDVVSIPVTDKSGEQTRVDCWMEITKGRFPQTSPIDSAVKVGSPLTLAIFVRDPRKRTDLRVKDCYAYDDPQVAETNGPALLQLTDFDGCPTKPKLIDVWRRTHDAGSTGATIIAFTTVTAFKFPDRPDLQLTCNIELCRNQCSQRCSSEMPGPVSIGEWSREIDDGTGPPRPTTARPSTQTTEADEDEDNENEAEDGDKEETTTTTEASTEEDSDSDSDSDSEETTTQASDGEETEEEDSEEATTTEASEDSGNGETEESEDGDNESDSGNGDSGAMSSTTEASDAEGKDGDEDTETETKEDEDSESNGDDSESSNGDEDSESEDTDEDTAESKAKLKEIPLKKTKAKAKTMTTSTTTTTTTTPSTTTTTKKPKSSKKSKSKSKSKTTTPKPPKSAAQVRPHDAINSIDQIHWSTSTLRPLRELMDTNTKSKSSEQSSRKSRKNSSKTLMTTTSTTTTTTPSTTTTTTTTTSKPTTKSTKKSKKSSKTTTTEKPSNQVRKARAPSSSHPEEFPHLHINEDIKSVSMTRRPNPFYKLRSLSQTKSTTISPPFSSVVITEAYSSNSSITSTIRPTIRRFRYRNSQLNQRSELPSTPSPQLSPIAIRRRQSFRRRSDISETPEVEAYQQFQRFQAMRIRPNHRVVRSVDLRDSDLNNGKTVIFFHTKIHSAVQVI